jgi:hypothetical protein
MSDLVHYRASDGPPMAPIAGGPLASERVVINSPMSFAGAAQRAWRIRESAPAGVARFVLTIPVVLLLIPLWWTVIVLWYVVMTLVFGLFFFGFRVLRRGARKRKAEALRHRELLNAVDKRRE